MTIKKKDEVERYLLVFVGMCIWAGLLFNPSLLGVLLFGTTGLLIMLLLDLKQFKRIKDKMNNYKKDETRR